MKVWRQYWLMLSFVPICDFYKSISGSDYVKISQDCVTHRKVHRAGLPLMGKILLSVFILVFPFCFSSLEQKKLRAYTNVI